MPIQETRREFWIFRVLPVLVIALLAWLSSGTLSPYAITSSEVRVLPPCNYLINEDHSDFKMNFLLLDGADRSQWENGPGIRRILHPLLAFPFMKIWGFELGGLIFNVLLHCVVAWITIQFVRKRMGPEAGAIFAWLLATYPGIYYWVGLPYAYSMVVPICLISMMLLWRLNERADPKRIAWSASAMGVMFLGYDLFPIIGGASLLLIAYRTRKAYLCALALTLLLLPSLLMALIMIYGLKVPLVTSNSASYSNILGAYLHWPNWPAWRHYLLDMPLFFKENYSSSGFLFLPLAFGLGLILNHFWKPLRLNAVEGTLAAAIFGLWWFNNFAPPYPGFQLRGSFVPRVYQPIFVVMLCWLSRKGQQVIREGALRAKLIGGGVLLFILAGNLTICLGPVLKIPLAADRYLRFYKHSGPIKMISNLDLYGVRPWGFCQK